MSMSIAKQDTPSVQDTGARLDQLAEIAEDVLRRCRARGASQAEVGLNEDLARATDHAPENLARLRRFALDLLRAERGRQQPRPQPPRLRLMRLPWASAPVGGGGGLA